MEFKDITIILTEGNIIQFTGKYLKDRETENWHYYESLKGELLHFKKSTMLVVIDQEATNTEIKFSKINSDVRIL